MPLIILCGYPCSGKSTIASSITELIKRKFPHFNVHLISECFNYSCSILQDIPDPRCEIYSDSKKERELRGQHKSEVERALTIGPTSLVIMDADNYIKGYRYELYCLAKSLKHHHLVLFCDVPTEVVTEWNTKINRYPANLLSDLIQRFEKPQPNQKWDKPLLMINPHLWDDKTNSTNLELLLSQLEQLLFVTLTKVEPNRSTQSIGISPTDYLQTLEHTTQQIIDHLLHSKLNGLKTVGLPETISNDTSDENIHIEIDENKFTVGDLMRFKRRFIGIQRNKFASIVKLDPSSVGLSFLRFISANKDFTDS